MPIEKFKDVTVNGREFQIGRVPALTGDWIARTLPSGAVRMGEETYRKIQGYLLETCSYYKNAAGTRVPMRIYRGGVWLCKDLDLEYDLDTVNALCEKVMEFNFTDFFDKRMAEAKALAEQPSATTQ